MAEPFLGEIRSFSFDQVPSGWAVCAGQLLAVSQNQALFSLLGIAYGGDGMRTFALPDLRGRTPVHPGNGTDWAQQGGEETHALTAAEMAAHSHTPLAGSDGAPLGTPAGHTWGTTPNVNLYDANANGTMAPSAIAPSGGGQGHNNMQPYLVMSYCIATTGIYPIKD